MSTANVMDEAQAAVLVQSATRRRRAARWHSQFEPTRLMMPELVEALASGDMNTFNLLLSRGASPDSVSHQSGLSSLHVACALQRADLVEQLIVGRDRLSEAEARARIEAQWPLARKRTLVDRCIDNSGDLQALEQAVLRALQGPREA